MRGARLTHAKLNGADLRDAHMGPLLIGQDRLLPCDLSGAMIKNADLRGADLRRALLTGANLSRSDFGGALLREADLLGAHFEGARGITPLP